MTRNVNIWKRIDKPVVLVYLLMVIMGWFNIYAAVFNEEHREIFDFSQRYGKQFIWIIAALVLAVLVMVTDTRFYFFFYWVIYGIMILMLILLFFFGKEINGSRSWFEFGFVSLQPSEFAKFATALALAGYLNYHRQELTRFRIILPALGIIILPALLTAAQPDMGSTIVFFALILVLFREGMSPYVFVSGLLMIFLFFLALLMDNYMLELILTGLAFFLTWLVTRKLKVALAGAGIIVLIAAPLFIVNHYLNEPASYNVIIVITLLVAGLFFAYYIYQKKALGVLVIYAFLIGSVLYVNTVDFVFDNFLKPHQKERVEIMLGFKSDPHGTGYNLNQSLISIGSGGFSGKGFLRGTQTKFKFVPAQSTDFIFCTVGEEWGFLGSVLIVGLYLFLMLRLIWLAERQRSVFSRTYGYGVVSILFIHFFVNLGMTIGLVPVIGIPLPFFSYGGSSLWGFTILLFVFLRLDASRSEHLI